MRHLFYTKKRSIRDRTFPDCFRTAWLHNMLFTGEDSGSISGMQDAREHGRFFLKRNVTWQSSMITAAVQDKTVASKERFKHVNNQMLMNWLQRMVRLVCILERMEHISNQSIQRQNTTTQPIDSLFSLNTFSWLFIRSMIQSHGHRLYGYSIWGEQVNVSQHTLDITLCFSTARIRSSRFFTAKMELSLQH